MQTLNSGIPIRQLSIIGTHNSMSTGVWGDAFQTQSNSLFNQMKMGIRALDIRCRHINNGFSIHDRFIYLNANLGNVLTDVGAFLASYSS
jgi:1-phosphatidylinositol phosphodiesterase